MLIYAVDDEPLALISLSQAIREARPDCRVREFSWGQPMLDAIAEGGERPNAVFLDIEMPGMSGVEAAKRVKLLSPLTWIVFVTAFSEYAMDAFSIHAKGYVLKPVSARAIKAELEAPALPPLPKAGSFRLHARAFGNFEVFVDGKPLVFARSKSKEMLAYLVHRMGAVCTTRELMAVLFEGRDDVSPDYFFKVSQCLKKTLANAGCAGVVKHSYKCYSVVTSLIDCDYYHFMCDSNVEAFNAYTGEYMAQYSWAEITSSFLMEQSDFLTAESRRERAKSAPESDAAY